MKKLITAVCILALIGSLGYMGNYYIQRARGEKAYEDLKETATDTTEKEDQTALEDTAKQEEIETK